MAYIKYDLHYSTRYQGHNLGSLDIITDDLKDVFDQLYKEVVIGSAAGSAGEDDSGSLENMNNINITITKRCVKSTEVYRFVSL